MNDIKKFYKDYKKENFAIECKNIEKEKIDENEKQFKLKVSFSPIVKVINVASFKKYNKVFK